MEAKKVAKLIQLNGEPNYVTKVDLNSGKEMVKCSETLAKTCPNTMIMLLCHSGKTMFVSVIVPDDKQEYLKNWLEESTKSVIVKECTTILGFENKRINMLEICYPENGEYFPLKLIDQVIGNSFAYLKKAGLYVEPEEEKEYDFDDIYAF